MIEPFDSEAGYRDAIDATIREAGQELCIFDSDLQRMMLDQAQRSALLAAFLTPAHGQRLRIVLHDIEPLQRSQPRTLNLIRRHGPQVEIRLTPDHLRQLSDRLVLADRLHGTIRFHADHPRGKRVVDDNVEILPIWQRFEDLWESSQTCYPAGTTGL